MSLSKNQVYSYNAFYSEQGMSNLQKGKKSILRTLKEHFYKILNAQCGFQKAIAKCSIKYILSYCSILFIIGRIILHHEPFRRGLIHQIVLSIISLLAIYMLKYCYSMGNKLLEAASGLKGNPKKNPFTQQTMYNIINDMKKWHRSIWGYILPVFPCLQFAKTTIYLEFVPSSMVGYYAVFCGAVAFYWALVAYIHLIISIIYFRKIAKNHGECLPLRFPTDLVCAPEWLKLWAEYFQQAEKAFFVTGTLFTFEYIILMPPDIITFDSKIVLNTKDSTAFIMSWMVIIILIIVAFPIISIEIRKLFRLLLSNLKKMATNEFHLLWDRAEKMSFSELWAYEQLSSNTIKFGAYVFQTKSYVPLISTGISILLNLAKLYESLIVPILSGIQN